MKKGFISPALFITIAVIFIGGVAYTMTREKDSEKEFGSIDVQNSQTNTTGVVKKEEAPVVSSDIRGSWDIDFQMEGDNRKFTNFFEGEKESGSFSNGINMDGKYYVSGKNAKWVPRYGNIECSGNFEGESEIKGTIYRRGGSVGTWSAKKNNEILVDVRGDWRFTTTSLNGSVSLDGYTFGAVMNDNSVPSTPAAGSLKTSNANAKYKVYYPEVEWKFYDRIEYKGTVIDAEHMSGTLMEYGKIPMGTWTAERKKE